MSQFTAAPSIPHNQQGGGAPEPAPNLDASHMGDNSGVNPMFNSSNKEHVQFAPSKPIEVASGVLSPTLIKKTVPEYPAIARNMHVSGVVAVAITITPQGTVAEAHAISGPILLRQSAVDAVRGWRFRPYLVNNHAVAVQSSVNVDFALQ
jgi:protein TonB